MKIIVIDDNNISKQDLINLIYDEIKDLTKQIKIKQYTHFTDIETLKDAVNFTQATFMGKEVTEDSPNYVKIRVIAKAINILVDNNRNFPDWNNKKETKYYPHFDTSYGMVEFYDSYSDCYGSDGQVAYLKTIEASDYVGNQFLKYYQDLINEKM